MKGQFYQNYLTDKSFQILQQLRKNYQFILIGGWAVYFYTGALKSKDIDIIVDFSCLNKLKNDFPLQKNDWLKKYQVNIEEIDIDIYLPYYSKLGLPVEKLINEKVSIKGFFLLKKEHLLLTKLAAYQKRKGTVKGEKDKIDIFALILSEDFNFSLFNRIVKNNSLKELFLELKKLIKITDEIGELGLNRHYLSKKKKEWWKRLAR